MTTYQDDHSLLRDGRWDSAITVRNWEAGTLRTYPIVRGDDAGPFPTEEEARVHNAILFARRRKR